MTFNCQELTVENINYIPVPELLPNSKPLKILWDNLFVIISEVCNMDSENDPVIEEQQNTRFIQTFLLSSFNVCSGLHWKYKWSWDFPVQFPFSASSLTLHMVRSTSVTLLDRRLKFPVRFSPDPPPVCRSFSCSSGQPDFGVLSGWRWVVRQPPPGITSLRMWLL